MSSAFLEELPHYYRNIREFCELSETVTADWDNLDEALFGLENDQFILTSSEAVIAIREKDFGIRADPKNETLKFRKLRLLARMQENAPYVLEYLLKLLATLLGEESHKVLLNIEKFEMEVFIDAEKNAIYDEVFRLLERVVPLNILIELALVLGKHMLTLRHFSYNYPIYYEKCGELITEPIMGVGVGSVMTAQTYMYDYPLYYPPADTFNTEMIAGNQAKTESTLQHVFSTVKIPYPVCGNFMAGGFI